MKSEHEPLLAQLKETEARLARRLNAIEHDLRHDKSPLQQDFAEQATATENDDVLQALGTSGISELSAIRAALARAEAGEYGSCVDCEKEIPLARLQVVPHAARCVACAEAAEG